MIIGRRGRCSGTLTFSMQVGESVKQGASCLALSPMLCLLTCRLVLTPFGMPGQAASSFPAGGLLALFFPGIAAAVLCFVHAGKYFVVKEASGSVIICAFLGQRQ